MLVYFVGSTIEFSDGRTRLMDVTLEVAVLCVKETIYIYIIRLAHLLEDTHLLLLSTIPQLLRYC